MLPEVRRGLPESRGLRLRRGLQHLAEHLGCREEGPEGSGTGVLGSKRQRKGGGERRNAMGGAPSCCYEEPVALPVEITTVPPAEAEEPEAQRAAVSNKWSRMENHRHLEAEGFLRVIMCYKLM